jgi:hypothetical protein
MKPFLPWILGLAAILILGVGVFIVRRGQPVSPGITPTPTLGVAEQLLPEKQPKVNFQFSSDAHYVTVNITNINAPQLEYNLIYEATVKGNQIQTGVNAAAKLEGKTEYSKQQLLGSESSGKFTYHTNIQSATMELTLRDGVGRSVFTATYPFTVSAGKSVDLQPAQ